MDINDSIQHIGLPATIIRTSGNITTYAAIRPIAKAASYSSMPFEREGMFPTTSGVVKGDLILFDDLYYLVVNARRQNTAGDYLMDRVRLFECNHIVTVKNQDETTKAWVVKTSSVPCLIISQSDRANIATDRSVILKDYRGQDAGYVLFCQSTAGIDRKSRIIDENNVPLSVTGNVDPYFVNGLIEVQVKIERPG